MKLEDKVAIVTGGGAGIGKAICLRFAAEGARVMVADIKYGSPASRQDTVSMIMDAGGVAAFTPTDVSKTTDAEKMVKQTIETFGQLDILVNNAGVWLNKPLVDVTESEWDHLIDINLKGTFLCSKYAIPAMMKNGGVIINMSSRAGLTGAPLATTYCASKGGVTLLTKALSLELKPFNIRVNALCPLLINTEMGRQLIKERNAAGFAVMPPASADEVANAALFLASDQSATITGIPLVVGEAGNL